MQHEPDEIEILFQSRGFDRLAGRADDAFSLKVGAGEDLGGPVAAFEPELADIERGQRFRLLLSPLGVCHILGKESRTARPLLSSVVKFGDFNSIKRKWRNWQ